MSFSWREAEELRKECIKALRKSKHKAENTGERKRIRKKFAQPDDSKIREIESTMTYAEWIAQRDLTREPLEANPDLFEDDLNDTVDGDYETY